MISIPFWYDINKPIRQNLNSRRNNYGHEQYEQSDYHQAGENLQFPDRGYR